MSDKSNNNGFFEWIVGLFKKPPPPSIIEPSPEEIAQKKAWDETRAKYSLEFVESYNQYFVRYMWRDQWWYLRRWDEDYTLERVRGNALRVEKPEQIDQIIYFHQDWIKAGHISLLYD
jgi:hypothetical protein